MQRLWWHRSHINLCTFHTQGNALLVCIKKRSHSPCCPASPHQMCHSNCLMPLSNLHYFEINTVSVFGSQGELTITTDMEELGNALFLDTVPDSWTKRAYPSLQGLGGWYADLLLRIKVRATRMKMSIQFPFTHTHLVNVTTFSPTLTFFTILYVCMPNHRSKGKFVKQNVDHTL